MGKKKNRNGGGEKRNDNQENMNCNNHQQKVENDDQQEGNNEKQKEEKNDGGGGGKKEDPPLLTVVLKMEVHCEGCATKIRKAVRRFKGVESARADLNSNKVTVVGKVDPAKLREFLEKKMNKKVEQLSPAPKKDKDNNKDGNGAGEKGKSDEKSEKKTDEKKKPKEPPVTTAVMKLNLHCQGCIEKIRKIVIKAKGYQELSIDEQKNQLTVKGKIDMKALAQTLKEKTKKLVEIVPPKKEGGEKDKGGDGGGEGHKEKGGDGKGGEEKKQKGGGQGGKAGGGEAGECQIVYMQCGFGYPSQCVNGFGCGYPLENYNHPAPQIFSDENPNACSVM